MAARDKRIMKKSNFSAFFLSYGAGQHYLIGLTKTKIWNLLSWTLIGMGVVGWVAFLM